MTEVHEEALVFPCAEDKLVGILARPAGPPQSTGVVVIVGGPQYRAGSHRQFVRLSRHLAAGGFCVLRPDYRGMGDSTGALRDFQQVTEDIAASIDALQAAVPAVERVVLWGLCDGASAALMYVERTGDSRLAGLCLLNPWMRTAASHARTQVRHYYWDRIRQRTFWTKLLSGQVAGNAAAGLWRNLRAARQEHKPLPPSADLPFTVRMLRGWQRVRRPILLVLSGHDYTAKEFLEHAEADTAWRQALQQPGVARHDFADADHTFSAPEQKAALEQLTLEWLQQCCTAAAAGRPH